MTQEAIALRTAGDTYPGVSVIQDVNKALATIATDFAGAADPASLAGPYMTWADTGNMLRKRRNAANTAWMTEGRLFADLSNVSLVGGFKNKIINGTFRINRRAYISNAVLAAGTYGHDRFKAGAAGGDYTFSQGVNSTQITIKTGKSLIQVVEDSSVEGGSYTLSWLGTAQARIGINSATPSGAYAASPITITSQTGGTVMSVEFNAGTLSDIQLEPGEYATGREVRPYGIEDILCQRYLPYMNFAIDAPLGVGQVVGTALARLPIRYPVRPRVAPTGAIMPAASGLYMTDLSYAAATLSVVTPQYFGPTSCSLSCTPVSGGFTAGHATTIASKIANFEIIFTGCEL